MTVFTTWHSTTEEVFERQLLLGFLSHVEGTLNWRHVSFWFLVCETTRHGAKGL